MAVSDNASGGKTTPVSHHSAPVPGDKAAQTRTGRPPTTSVLRSAMYYQNRIIIPEVKSRQATGGANRDTGSATSSASGALMNGPNVKSGRPDAQKTNNPNFRSEEHSDRTICGATSQAGFSSDQKLAARGGMDARGIDIVVTDTDGANRKHKVKKKKKSICTRINQVLQDNRMKGEPNAEFILAVSNPADFRLLKKVLNISFLTIGIALLVSVIIVIIYTAIAA